MQSVGFSLILAVLYKQSLASIFIAHLAPIVVEVLHETAAVLSGRSVSVRGVCGCDVGEPSVKVVNSNAMRALQFLQIVTTTSGASLMWDRSPRPPPFTNLT